MSAVFKCVAIATVSGVVGAMLALATPHIPDSIVRPKISGVVVSDRTVPIAVSVAGVMLVFVAAGTFLATKNASV